MCHAAFIDLSPFRGGMLTAANTAGNKQTNYNYENESNFFFDNETGAAAGGAGAGRRCGGELFRRQNAEVGTGAGGGAGDDPCERRQGGWPGGQREGENKKHK